MKTLQVLLLFLCVPTIVSSQNLMACDSLIINCCTYDTISPNTITIEVTNTSSVLFDYPGFVLLNSNMDTIAIEQVNYFGIGNSPQMHTLHIVAPFMLPFTGYLNLYMLFGDSLACSFPITIPDTTTSLTQHNPQKSSLHIYPNPASASAQINFKSDLLTKGEVAIFIVDLYGRVIQSEVSQITKTNLLKIDISDLAPGAYWIRLNQNGKTYFATLVKI